MADVIWTDDQVKKLNEYQESGRMHPFTCGSGNRGDEAHTAYQIAHGGDLGQLVATSTGWVCPVEGCGYTQQGAHDFMFLGAPKMPWEEDDTDA